MQYVTRLYVYHPLHWHSAPLIFVLGKGEGDLKVQGSTATGHIMKCELLNGTDIMNIEKPDSGR